MAPRAPSDLRLVRTSFTGRDRELAELAGLVRESAVVTLVGPGGVDKTRLALEFAHRALDDFPDGVRFVDLAPLASPALVVPEVAAAVGVGASPDALRLLVEQLGGRRVLLLLDNCEHLVDEVARVADRLAGACPDLRVLATSREPLGLAAETCLPVSPLGADDAVRLFADRARAADARFRLGAAGEDRDAVAALCDRLDGVPLAIELAAPWVRLLSPRELLPRLDDRFALLTASRRDLPPRQRTMRATVEWSHQLLPEPERHLFRRLATFRGTFDLAAAEGVCGGPPLEPGRVASLLAGLQERSMVAVERGAGAAGASRFRLLETLRDFSAERLDASGERDDLRRRHFVHYLGRAEAVDAERRLTGSDAGVTGLLPDGDDLRAALEWGIERDPPGALRLAAALEGFWMVRSVAEGRRWVESALARAPEPTRHRARALIVSPFVVAGGVPWPEARRHVEASIDISTAAGDETGAAMARLMLALSAFFNGQVAAARTAVEDALARHAGLDHPLFHARATTYLGAALSFTPHRLEDGRERLREGGERSRGMGDAWGLGLALTLLGLADLRAGAQAAAGDHLRAAIRATMQAGVTATAVGGLGQLALETDPRRACVLLEAATAVLERTGVPRFPVEVGRQLDRARLAAERRLARPVAEACRARARAMSTGEALAYALTEAPAAGEGDRLTARQQEVALLVAEGRSNREISERLHLSVRTVESHVDNILTELGFHSRARLAAWVREAGLGDP